MRHGWWPTNFAKGSLYFFDVLQRGYTESTRLVRLSCVYFASLGPRVFPLFLIFSSNDFAEQFLQYWAQMVIYKNMRVSFQLESRSRQSLLACLVYNRVSLHSRLELHHDVWTTTVFLWHAVTDVHISLSYWFSNCITKLLQDCWEAFFCSSMECPLSPNFCFASIAPRQ